MARTFYDTFTDADGTALDEHTPDTDLSGQGWRLDDGRYEISSNRCVPTADGSAARPGIITSFDALSPNGLLLIQYLNTGAASTEDVGLRFRIADDGTFFLAAPNNGENHIGISFWNGSTLEELAVVAVEIDPDTPYRVPVLLRDSYIEASVDGVSASVVDSRNLNETRCGFRCRNTVGSKYFDLVSFDAFAPDIEWTATGRRPRWTSPGRRPHWTA